MHSAVEAPAAGSSIGICPLQDGQATNRCFRGTSVGAVDILITYRNTTRVWQTLSCSDRFSGSNPAMM